MIRCEMEHEFNFFFDNFIDGSSTQITTKATLEKIMAERLARKPELIQKLIPNFGVGCRRVSINPCLSRVYNQKGRRSDIVYRSLPVSIIWKLFARIMWRQWWKTLNGSQPRP